MDSSDTCLELLKDSKGKVVTNEIVEMNILVLLGKVVERYTMGDSTSIPVETAEELLKSIIFLLDKERKNLNCSVNLFEKENLEEIWKSSWKVVEEDIEIAEKLLEEVVETSPKIENRSYIDT